MGTATIDKQKLDSNISSMQHFMRGIQPERDALKIKHYLRSYELKELRALMSDPRTPLTIVKILPDVINDEIHRKRDMLGAQYVSEQDLSKDVVLKV